MTYTPTTSRPLKVLIVGAGGFIGGFMAAESLARGYETWCGVRETTSRRRLTDPRLRFITLDYDNPDRLKEQLDGHRWDYIVYNLGATKCVNFMDFNRINYVYLRDFTEALEARALCLRRWCTCHRSPRSGPVMNAATPRCAMT